MAEKPRNSAVDFAFEQIAVSSQTEPGATQIESYEETNLQGVEVYRAGQRPAELIVYAPANAKATAKAQALLTEVSLANKLGTHRPTKMLIAIHPDKHVMFFMPVRETTSPNAIPIVYNGLIFSMNLHRPFTLLGRVVPTGFKESYQFEVTQNPIAIGGVTGRALFIRLEKPERSSIKPMPDAVREARRANRQAQKSEWSE